ncbi:acyltransferase family protein [Nostoc sp.]|uniref:acyltransferase family protein n=1 Tax=Nostoc sp. TaxID=1180 RepID=UPI002FFC3EAF
MAKSNSVDSSYIPYIDGLRAIAVVAVVIYHLNSTWLPGGFTGVDIFFTISGFVVSFSIAKKRGLSPANFVASFYARRILRIVPALLTCLILVSLAEVLFIPMSWLSDGIERTGQYAFFGLSNFILMIPSNNYFGPKAEFNPFIHTWSLGIEEQFYLIFPMLFYWWTIADKNNRLRYISISIFTVLSAFSIACAWWLSHIDGTSAFYSIFSRFWELAAGVILYQTTAHKYDNPEIDSGFKWSFGVSISLVLVILGFVFARPENFPFPWAFLPVLGTTGLLVFLRGNKNNLILAGLSNKFVVFIGTISYSLYLWHWPVFVLFRWTVGLESIPCYISAVFLAFFLAFASYYFVERPIRSSHKIRDLPRAKIIFVGLTVVALAFYITNTQIFLHKTQLSLSVTSKEYNLWYPNQPDIATFNKFNNNCPIESSVKHIEGGSFNSFSSPNCRQQRAFSRLFVAGDSHADAYTPMLGRLTMETNNNVFIYSKPGCAYISLFAPLDQLSSDCQLFYRSTTTDILNHAQRGDIIFLPSLRLKRFAEQWTLFAEETVREEMSGKDALSNRASATKEAITLLKPFVQRGIKVVFEASKPIFRAPSFRCSDWFNRMNPICKLGLEMQKDVLINYRLPVMESMETLSKQVSGVSVWDPFPLLCPGNFCKTTMDDKPLFFDGDHISGYGNMLVYPSFKTFITELMQDQGKRISILTSLNKSGMH